MTHATCRLTTKNRDQLRNPTLGNRVWATFFAMYKLVVYTSGLPTLRNSDILVIQIFLVINLQLWI